MSRKDYVDLPEWLNRVDNVLFEKETDREKVGEDAAVQGQQNLRQKRTEGKWEKESVGGDLIAGR